MELPSFDSILLRLCFSTASTRSWKWLQLRPMWKVHCFSGRSASFIQPSWWLGTHPDCHLA
ncbi:hypothetical protein CABS01_07336 [Colletotrichum abscissum]|uniref:uncharacterized protein n=1 Tax=Colletotrichum abscissum TaxID=1671311 RepID=UPI0027D58B1E|nr:uncharacterized protein CABS01_07336 [Colletotrichum abscissum]KAK1513930.1 hypothetical protein CABS01_07336 [Colletotrichum abscissum]